MDMDLFVSIISTLVGIIIGEAFIFIFKRQIARSDLILALTLLIAMPITLCITRYYQLNRIIAGIILAIVVLGIRMLLEKFLPDLKMPYKWE